MVATLEVEDRKNETAAKALTKLKTLVDKIFNAQRKTLAWIIEAGGLIASLKDNLPRGEKWEQWILQNAGVHERVARNWMAAYRHREQLQGVDTLSEALQLISVATAGKQPKRKRKPKAAAAAAVGPPAAPEQHQQPEQPAAEEQHQQPEEQHQEQEEQPEQPAAEEQHQQHQELEEQQPEGEELTSALVEAFTRPRVNLTASTKDILNSLGEAKPQGTETVYTVAIASLLTEDELLQELADTFGPGKSRILSKKESANRN